MNNWALITGAAKRIGRAIALELAASGFDIVVHYHKSQDEAKDLATEIQAMGRQVALAELDLTNVSLAANLIPSLSETIGPITALINNASLFELDQSDPSGKKHMALNFEAPSLLSRALRDHLPRDKRGVIVNLLDANPPEAPFASYTASKKALLSLTYRMARDMAPAMRVNGIALGPILKSPRQSLQHFKNLVEATPLRLQITPEAVALTVRFLIENNFMTGVIIPLDAGAHLRLSSDTH